MVNLENEKQYVLLEWNLVELKVSLVANHENDQKLGAALSTKAAGGVFLCAPEDLER